MNSVCEDLRFGWRMLAKAPGFTTVAILTLALGIVLDELQMRVLQPEAVEYAISELGRQLKTAFNNLSVELAEIRERKQKLETEPRKLAETAAQTGPSGFLVEAISDRERQLREITERLLSREPSSIESHLSGIRQFVTKRLADLQEL